MPAVHVVGNVCLDTSFRVARFPRAGETLNADECAVGLGGKGANQALAAARTGAQTWLWAATGADADASTIRQLMAEAGLRTDGLATVGPSSDRSTIIVDATGENLIVSAVEASRAFAAQDGGWVERARAGDILVMQNNLGAPATSACLALARRNGLFTLLNASPLGGDAHLPLADVDLVIVNRGEGEDITGESRPDRIVARLRASGARAAIVTLGAKGALFLDAKASSPVEVAAEPAAARDTSGAGDVFCGTLAGLLSLGRAPGEAIGIATRAASVAVTRTGAFGCGPSAAAMNDMVKEQA